MRHPIMFLRSLSPFNWSHHPDCESFRHHCVQLRGRRLCIGCFIGFPVTIATFIALVIASSLGIQLDLQEVLLLGLGIEVSALLIKTLHFSKRVLARVAMKIVQAVGLAFIFFSPLTLQAPILFKLFIVFMLWSLFNTLMGAVRIYETGKTCTACEHNGSWSKCPGFKNLVKQLGDSGFLV